MSGSLLVLTAEEERAALMALGRLPFPDLTPCEQSLVYALYRRLDERERLRAAWDAHSAKARKPGTGNPS